MQIGRDRLNWGSGNTGNLVLSDNFPYHDMIRATAYSPTGTFKYTYLLSFFTSKMNYYDVQRDSDGSTSVTYQGTNGRSSADILKGLALYSAHRFEGRFFNDRLSLSLTEALTLDSQDGSIPFLALSPLYFMHNAYMPNNTNSTLAFEINWTVTKGLAFYGQMLLDNFAMPGFETGPGAGKSQATTPDGKAFLIGAKYMTAAGKGILTVNPEVVYVMPLTYLRDSRSGYGIDYVAAVKYRLYSYESYAGNTDILYDEYVIGYTYGPDCLTASSASTGTGRDSPSAGSSSSWHTAPMTTGRSGTRCRQKHPRAITGISTAEYRATTAIRIITVTAMPVLSATVSGTPMT